MHPMPAATVRLNFGAGSLEVGADGAATLHAVDAPVVTVGLTDVDGLGMTADTDDEVEHAFSAQGLQVYQRHSTGESWRMRWVVANPTPRPASVTLRLSVIAAPGRSVWCWAAGSSGLVVVAPRERAGPVLLIRLDQGHLDLESPASTRAAATSPRLRLAPDDLLLDPGRRWVVAATASWVPDLADAMARLPPWMEWPFLLEGESWVAALADVGVTLPEGVHAVLDAETSLLQVRGGPGRHVIGVHEARGITRVALEWAPPLTSAATSIASAALASPGDRPGAAESLCIQHALQQGTLAEREFADDLLERVDWTRDGSLLAIAFGLQQAVRTGEAAAVTEALDLLGRLPVTVGFGRVVLRAWLACVATGLDAQQRCLGLLSRPAVDEVAALESALLRRSRPESGVPAVAGLVNRLGGRLPGEPFELDWRDQAQLVGILELCPERWPVAGLASEVAAKTRTRILAAWADRRLTDPEAIAWLLLAGIG